MEAAKYDWRALSCEQCPNLGLNQACRRLQFVAVYYRRLAEIYPEFKRKYEGLMDSFDLEV
jgi:hypothetical protein